MSRTAALTIVKEAVAGQAADVAGEQINYTLAVQNTGNSTLSNVVVTDPFADVGSIVRGADAVGDDDALLEVGETWSYTAFHTVTQGEIDSNGGGDNCCCERGDGGQRRERSGQRRCERGGEPPQAALTVVEEGRGWQAADVAGEQINYTLAVQNTGNSTLSNVVVTDPFADVGSIVRGADAVGDDGLLCSTSARRGSTRRPIPSPRREIDSNGGGDGDPGEHGVRPTATQTDPDSDDARRCRSSQNAGASTSSRRRSPARWPMWRASTITYTITVQNTGNPVAHRRHVTNTVRGRWAPTYVSGDGRHDRDARGRRDVDLHGGPHRHPGRDRQQRRRRWAAGEHGFGGQRRRPIRTPTTRRCRCRVHHRSTSSRRRCAGQVADVAGEAISYTITVENTGNTSLTGVTVTDPYRGCAGSTYVSGDVAAPMTGCSTPDEMWTYTAAHTVTQGEIDSNGGGDGLLENTATADSDADRSGHRRRQRAGGQQFTVAQHRQGGQRRRPGGRCRRRADQLHDHR